MTGRTRTESSGKTVAPRRILILDPDRRFALYLAAALQKHYAGSYHCRIATADREALQIMDSGEMPEALILRDQMPLHPHLKSRLNAVPVLRRKVSLNSGSAADCLTPGMKLNEIHSILEGKLAASFPEELPACPLLLLYSFSQSVRRQWLRLFRDAQQRKGRRLYYLGLAPSYDLSLPVEEGEGPELSSLLLRLNAGQEPEAKDLGACFQSQHGAFFYLRCGGRADDLLLCGLKLQKRLLLLARDFIRQEDANSIALVECAGLPFSSLRILAPVADFFLCDRPKESGLAGRSARRELSALLSSLPATLRFLELNPEDFRHGSDPLPEL